MVLALVFFTAPVGVAAAADDDLRSPHEGLAASDSSSPDDGEDDGGGSDEDGEDERIRPGAFSGSHKRQIQACQGEEK